MTGRCHRGTPARGGVADLGPLLHRSERHRFDVGGIGEFAGTADVPHYSMMVRNDLVVGLVQGTGAGDLHGQSALTAAGVVRLETGRVVDSDAGSTHDSPTYSRIE